MGHLRRFYEQVPWTRLRPTDCFRSGSGINDAFYPPHVTADDRRSTVVVFFGENYRRGASQAHVLGVRDARYTVRWFDPRIGTWREASSAVPVAGRLDVPDKPDDRDWLLLLQARAAGPDEKDLP